MNNLPCNNDTNNPSNMNNTFNALVQLNPIYETELKDLRAGFFVDTSGSTTMKLDEYQNISILETEKFFVKSFDVIKEKYIVSWNSLANRVESVEQLTSGGTTNPSIIFNDSESLTIIRNIDVAFILTDGYIDVIEIKHFGEKMIQHGCHLKAVIGVIVNKRDEIPGEVNISVLIPSMISNSCILFIDYQDNYVNKVMWSSGSFKKIWNPHEITKESRWNDISSKTINDILHMKIPIVDEIEENRLIQNRYIPFGSGHFFNPQILLESDYSADEFMQFPFDRISQYFRITYRCEQLYEWFNKHKQKFALQNLNLPENLDLINNLINLHSHNSNIQDPNIPLIRTNFTRVRNDTLYSYYVDEPLNWNNIFNISSNPLNTSNSSHITNFMGSIGSTMRSDIYSQDNGNSYNTSSFSSIRYHTSNNGSTRISNGSTRISSGINFMGSISSHSVDDVETMYDYLIDDISNSKRTDISFERPLKWFTMFEKEYPNHVSKETECSICCENSIPFILIRLPIDITQITQNPLSYFYPRPLCYKCADFFCIQGKDPYRVECFAALPIIGNVENIETIFYFDCYKKISIIDLNHKNNSVTNDEPVTTISKIRNFFKSIKIKSKHHDNKRNNKEDFGIKTLINILKPLFPDITEHLDEFNKNFS